MTLADVLGCIEEYAHDLVIYVEARPEWSEHSRAIVLPELEDASAGTELSGMKYLVEVDTAREVIRVWSSWRAGRVPTPRERCDAVIYYAINDSYEPV